MRLLIAAVAAGTAVVLAAAPATAAELRLDEPVVDTDAGTIALTLSAEQLPPGTGLDPASVLVRLGDRDLPATATVTRSETETDAPRVLLVVDTSGSMLGGPMEEAKQAITNVAAQAPAEVSIGLARFSTEAQVVVEPTQDRARLLGAVTALQSQGETALYDAVRNGLSALGRDGDRRLVVLSDGGDTRSRSSLDTVLAEARSSGAVVDAIGFRTDETVSGVLEDIAAAGRGRVHAAANAAELSAALAATVRTHARALTVQALLPPHLTGRHDLQVSVSSRAGVLTSTTRVALADAGGSVAEPSWWSTRSALLAGIAAIAAALLLGSLALLDPGRGDRRRVRTVLDRYTTAPVEQHEDIRTASPVARTAIGVAEKVATSRGLNDRLSQRLDRAAVSLRPAEWLLLQAGVAFGLVFFLVLLGWHLLLALLVGTVVGAVVPNRVLASKGAKRQKAFEDKLPDTLTMAAGSLSAGYSLAQALDGVVREGTEPTATEFGRALAESRLGVPIESTLEGVAERMGSRDFAWVVMAVKVQREVGGNLAGILTTVAGTMRERTMLRRHVRALSAEGRLSAWILIALPALLASYMLLLRGDYIRPLYTKPLGLMLLGVAAVMITIGSFVMSRMVKVEV